MNPRRRALCIAAVAAGSGVSGSLAATAGAQLAQAAGVPGAAVAEITPVVWMGSAFGAAASIRLVDADRARARAAVSDCVAELERIERVFSLYRPDSAISRLNRDGFLDAPPAEMVELMSFALSLARASDGWFDPTVQPLFAAYAAHAAALRSSAIGERASWEPGGTATSSAADRVETVLPAEVLAKARRSVGFEGVELSAGRIAFRRPGMAVTLNGVAQGFASDRIAELLSRKGFVNVLVDMGEARALGQPAPDRGWRAAVADARDPARTLFELELGERAGRWPALATSAASGHRFEGVSGAHHLFDPHTGTCPNRCASVSVAAPRATLADGLSTALAVMPREQSAGLLARWPAVRAWFASDDGSVSSVQAALT